MGSQTASRPYGSKPAGRKRLLTRLLPARKRRRLEEPSNQSHVARKRMRISEENLHISAFAIVGDGKGSILLLKAGQAHPLSFRRGNLLLPAVILEFGEWPFTAAKRAVTSQLEGAEPLEPKFRQIQSYMGSHWDLCFVYDFDGRKAAKLSVKPPYVEASYHRLSALPREAIAPDHLEVIEGMAASEQS